MYILLSEKVANCNKLEIAKKVDIDMYTLNDILDAFAMPLRDIRDTYDGLILRSDIMHFEDVKVGVVEFDHAADGKSDFFVVEIARDVIPLVAIKRIEAT